MSAVKKLFTVTDLGGGDGGKGGVVHKIADMMRAHTVVKVGGAQGSHGVRTARGEQFAFSQFGCGTFEGARTHVSCLMVIDPIGMLREGEVLRREWRIHNVFDTITIDGGALSITPYHGIASKLHELARKGNPRGTIGVGVGEAYRDSILRPDLAIRAKDLGRADLRDLLEAVRAQKTQELEAVIDAGFDPADEETAQGQIKLLRYPRLVEWTLEQFRELVGRVRVVDREYFRKEVLAKDGVVVMESSHGVLTDHYYGFHPHTSKLRTLPRFTHDLVRECGYNGQVIKLGVHRAYQIRHGAGPMVTESPEMLDALLPGSSKEENRWQGKVRVGPIDFVAMRYAMAVCGGPQAFDGIALTWFDQIQKNGNWSWCERYLGTDSEFFSPSGDIVVRRGEDAEQLVRQERLGQALRACNPIVSSQKISCVARQGELVEMCSSVLRDKLRVPVCMISFGPTEREKVCV